MTTAPPSPAASSWILQPNRLLDLYRQQQWDALSEEFLQLLDFFRQTTYLSLDPQQQYAIDAFVNYSQLKQGAFSSPAVSKPTTSLWGGLQHPQSTVTSALNNRFWCPQYNYNLRQLKLLKELSSPH